MMPNTTGESLLCLAVSHATARGDLLFNPVKLLLLVAWLYLCLYFTQLVQYHHLVPINRRVYVNLLALVFGPLVLVYLYAVDILRAIRNTDLRYIDIMLEKFRQLASLLRGSQSRRVSASRIILLDSAGQNFAEQYGRDKETKETLRVTENVISGALLKKASDILIDPKTTDTYTVRYRVDGMLRMMDELSADKAAAVINSIKAVAGMDISERRRPQDGAFTARDETRSYSFRVSSAGVLGGEKLSLRVLGQNTSLLNLHNIGLAGASLQAVEDAIARPSGMILICGPTGSGKTTTLYAMLNNMDFFSRNVVTVEDPVEYVLPNTSQIEVNVKADITFAKALRSILRQDPDVIVVGEIRDEETASIAIKAAETGHLVLATMHSSSNSSSLVRLMDLGIKPLLITAAVQMLMSQRLVRKLCEKCKKPAVLKETQRRAFEQQGLEAANVYVAVGCPECDNTGYSGRMSIFDIMPMTTKLKAVLTDPNLSMSDLESNGNAQCRSNLRREGLIKVAAGLTTLEEVKRVTSDLG
jgi:type II secretory ATPase GspE/PulE/Tfp pilus assembly ATPase PilB-like protein